MRIAKLFLTGILLTILGAFSLAAKFLLPEARLPFWPFDGVLAVAGGVFVIWWSIQVIMERDGEPPASSQKLNRL